MLIPRLSNIITPSLLSKWLPTVEAMTNVSQHLPVIHHSDQGWQYACPDYTDLLTEYRAQISMAAVGKPEENGYAERPMRTIKEEEVDLSEYVDFHDAYRSIGRF